MVAQQSSPAGPGLEAAAAGHPPFYLTPLIGRAAEIADVCDAVARHRLVTLVGPGGGGKTRLAASVAERIAATGERVVWTELAGLEDAGLVAPQIRTALGAADRGDRPPVDVLIGAIGASPLLLVLDNCEHLVDACAELARVLLGGCPRLRILATSRQALGVPGEQIRPLPPLSLPPDDDEPLASAALAEAIQLFVQRATDVHPGFRLTEENAAAVSRICRRLDGLPLAIELAAARVTVLPPEQLARRLDHIFEVPSASARTLAPRHRTVRALIEWSYELLTERERLLLDRLAVFAGGFTLDAAEAVTADGPIRPRDVLELLATLVDKSLVTMRERAGEARYYLLDTVRHYAAERLTGSVEPAGSEPRDGSAPHRRHAVHFLELAESGAVQRQGDRQLAWLGRIEAEHDNLRAALRWCIAAGEGERALRFCSGLASFWAARGHLGEGRRWADEALGLAGGPAQWQARALLAASELARLQADHAAALSAAVAAERLAREADDRLALAEALTSRGIELALRHETGAARACLEEAVARWGEGAGGRGLTRALGALASLAQHEGDFARARALRNRAIEVVRDSGDREGEAHAWMGLGELARAEDDAPTAKACYQRALALWRELGGVWHVAAALHNLGWAQLRDGAPESALESWLEAFRAQAGSGNAVAGAYLLAAFAPLLHARGEPLLAARALAAAYARLAAVGIQPAPADAREWERTRDELRTAHGGAALDSAWEEGSAADADRLLADVLRVLGTVEPLHPSRAAAAAPVPGDAPQAEAPAHPDLDVRALGPLRIARGGEPLELDRFGSAKPRELLLFLLCHPRGCTRDEVGRALWPESSPAQVRSSFHTTMHRLRRALGDNDWIHFEQDRYRVEPPGGLRFDAREFEHMVTAALEGKAADGSALLAKALDLYGGDLLADEVVGRWHLEHRDRLAGLFRSGLRELAERRFATGDFTAARDLFQRLVRSDDLQEDAYRRLMLCHARLGEVSEAMRVYRRLERLLRDELQTEPEEETTALFRELASGAP